MKVFIGGSRKISRLNEIIRKRLHNIIEQGFTVLVGDANGADKAVQSYFHKNKYNEVLVYCSGLKCRNNIGGWSTINVEIPSNVQGLKFYMVKDSKMSEDADYGFMIWDGKSAGTLNNVLNLLKQHKKALVYFSPNKNFYTISKSDDLRYILNLCDTENIEKINSKISLTKIINEISSTKQIQLPL